MENVYYVTKQQHTRMEGEKKCVPRKMTHGSQSVFVSTCHETEKWRIGIPPGCEMSSYTSQKKNMGQQQT